MGVRDAIKALHPHACDIWATVWEGGCPLMYRHEKQRAVRGRDHRDVCHLSVRERGHAP